MTNFFVLYGKGCSKISNMERSYFTGLDEGRFRGEFKIMNFKGRNLNASNPCAPIID